VQRISPNTFLVGAPKSGTTALAGYMSQHPEVFFSTPKELHYFSGNEFEQVPRFKPNLDSYLSKFADSPPDCGIIAEGSVWYLYSDFAVQRISVFNPKAKLIVMLRRPIEMVYSQHSMHLQTSYETEVNFKKAWNRSLQMSENDTTPENRLLQYTKIANYGDQLEKVFNYFSKDQVHVIIYDDFCKDNMLCLAELCSFLNINSDFEFEPHVVNENRIIKSKYIGEFTSKPPLALVSSYRNMKKKFGLDAYKLGLLRRLRRANSKKVTRLPLDEKFSKSIVNHYRPQILKLESIIDRRLESWLEN